MHRLPNSTLASCTTPVSGVEAAQKFLGYQNGKMPDYDVPLAKLLKENFKQNEKN